MGIVTSGSGSATRRPRFTMTPRHEVRLAGLAPMPSRAVIASFRGGGMSGLGEAPAYDGFPVLPIVVYAVLAGLMIGTVHARRRG